MISHRARMSGRHTVRAVARTGVLVALAAVVAGCDETEFGEPLTSPYARHMQLRYVDRATEPDSSIDAYIDYSAGMEAGMRATADVLDRLENFLGGRRVSYYRVGAADAPTPIDINSPAANFLNLANFTDRGSKLGAPLDRIRMNLNRTSIFVTDFERVEDPALRQMMPGAPAPHPIDASAWGQRTFRKWLENGNRLDVFARRFDKADVWFDKKARAVQSNWVYILVFTPAADARNPDRLKGSVLGYLLDEHKKISSEDFQHFAVWADGVTIERTNDAANGNANENAPPQEFVIDSTTGVPFEYYAFSADDIQTLQTMESQEDRRLLNGVKLSAAISVLDTFALGLDVRDVTQALAELEASDAAAAQPIVLDTNPETGKIDTVKGGGQRPNSAKPGEPVANAFDLVYNASTREIGIKVNENFAYPSESTTYRVAVILKEVTPAPFEDPKEALSLQYSRGYKINALRESIRLAVRDVAAAQKGRELYVFYLTIDP